MIGQHRPVHVDVLVGEPLDLIDGDHSGNGADQRFRCSHRVEEGTVPRSTRDEDGGLMIQASDREHGTAQDLRYAIATCAARRIARPDSLGRKQVSDQFNGYWPWLATADVEHSGTRGEGCLAHLLATHGAHDPFGYAQVSYGS